MDTTQIVQLATACMAFAASIVWYKFRINHKTHKYATVAPLAYLIHTMVFYASVAIFSLNGTSIGLLWSAALRLHTQITLFIMGLQVTEEFRKKDICHHGDS